MRRSFAEARRVLKPGAPLVCVYAHRTTESWATLIRALVEPGLTVTEAWPVQTESRERINALGAAALCNSIFFVARRRKAVEAGQYETEVEPELHRIARERVTTLWAGGKGVRGADLLMAAVGAGLRAYTRFARVEYANGEVVPAERYLREVEGVALDVMLDEIFGLRGAAVGSMDPATRFYILWTGGTRPGGLRSMKTANRLWLECVDLHPDVLLEELSEDVFALDLGALAGHLIGRDLSLPASELPRVPAVYRDADSFFGASYLTGGLKSLLEDMPGRLVGSRGRQPHAQAADPRSGAGSRTLWPLCSTALGRGPRWTPCRRRPGFPARSGCGWRSATGSSSMRRSASACRRKASPRRPSGAGSHGRSQAGKSPVWEATGEWIDSGAP